MAWDVEDGFDGTDEFFDLDGRSEVGLVRKCYTVDLPSFWRDGQKYLSLM